MGQGSKQPGFKQLMEGFRLVHKSAYLLSISLFLILASSVSSFMYFQRSLVVAAASDAASSRVAMFASMSGASALGIAALQLLATVRDGPGARGRRSAALFRVNETHAMTRFCHDRSPLLQALPCCLDMCCVPTCHTTSSPAAQAKLGISEIHIEGKLQPLSPRDAHMLRAVAGSARAAATQLWAEHRCSHPGAPHYSALQLSQDGRTTLLHSLGWWLQA